MSGHSVATSTGDMVTVTNTSTVTRYYRGRYYRTSLTVSTTPSGFRLTSRDVFTYPATTLRWFYCGDPKHEMTYRRDYTNVTDEAPF